MNNRQLSKFNAYRQTELNINKANPAIIAALPMFATWFTAFKNELDSLNNHLDIQIAQSSGIQINKADIRLNLVIAANNLSIIIQSYATTIDDLELYAAMAYTKTTLTRKSSYSLIAACNLIATAANQNIAALAPYDVTPLSMLDFSNLTQSFKAIEPLPRAAKQNKTAATLAIKNTFSQADTLLRKMDGVIRTIQLKHPIFTNSYFLARKINNPQQKKMAARGQITNAAGEPMPQVLITSASLNLKRYATKKGRFGIRNARKGKHQISFFFPGYKPVTQSITITTSLRAELSIIMIPL